MKSQKANKFNNIRYVQVIYKVYKIRITLHNNKRRVLSLKGFSNKVIPLQLRVVLRNVTQHSLKTTRNVNAHIIIWILYIGCLAAIWTNLWHIIQHVKKKQKIQYNTCPNLFCFRSTCRYEFFSKFLISLKLFEIKSWYLVRLLLCVVYKWYNFLFIQFSGLSWRHFKILFQVK